MANNPQLGAELRDRAIDATEIANTEWVEMTYKAVVSIAKLAQEFTTDRVWHVIGDVAPPEPRAMGAVMRKAVANRICGPTDRTVKSVRPNCHRRPIRVWRSLIFRTVT